MRFLRIRAVQKVIRDPTQLSGRGFSSIFYMELILSQSYVTRRPRMGVGTWRPKAVSKNKKGRQKKTKTTKQKNNNKEE